LMEADAGQVRIRTSYNLSGLSFSPEELVSEIKMTFPQFEIIYKPDFRQEIAGSWPERIDDSEARAQWGWKPKFDLTALSSDMIVNLERKYKSKIAV
jgi:threonine 3-dehydrogenase